MSALSPQQQRAAWLVALDEMTRAEVAAAVGITERQLYNWRQLPEFQAAVETHCRRLVQELIPPALARLKRIIRRGKDGDANKAIATVLRAAGLLEPTDDGVSADDDLDAALTASDERESIPTPGED